MEIPQFSESINTQVSEQYLKDLDLTWEDLKGKNVLDIGAGLGRFAQIAASKGVVVTSLEKDPSWWTDTGVIARDIEDSYHIADARKPFPFPDNSFDYVVIHSAFQETVDTNADLNNVLNESNRVLKVNGEFRAGPGYIDISEILPEEWVTYLQLNQKMKNQSLNETEKEILAALEKKVEKESNEQKTLSKKQKALDLMRKVIPTINLITTDNASYFQMKKS